MEEGAVYIEENWGMYGLPQSGLLANQMLRKTPPQARLLPKQVSTGFMETQMATIAIYAGGGQFQSQICWQGTCIIP